jgi:molybdopterin molybdotransferase
MISVEEARGRILNTLKPTPPEVVALAQAWHRVTAQPVTARLTQPPADVSAMDGYALRAADGGLGAELRVIGAAPAGHPFDRHVGPGQAVRLFTGSVVPDGADAILLQEDATRDGDGVRVNEAVVAGRHIRRAGQDFAAGDVVVPAGRRITARDVGVAAAANHPWLSVHRRPRVAILATGDEIVMPGEPIPPGGIVSSNAHALAALVRAVGGEPMILPIARDEHAAIGAVAESVTGMDILVTTGGASVGDHDLVIEALQARGMTLDFWQIAMRRWSAGSCSCCRHCPVCPVYPRHRHRFPPPCSERRSRRMTSAPIISAPPSKPIRRAGLSSHRSRCRTRQCCDGWRAPMP